MSGGTPFVTTFVLLQQAPMSRCFLKLMSEARAFAGVLLFRLSFVFTGGGSSVRAPFLIVIMVVGVIYKIGDDNFFMR